MNKRITASAWLLAAALPAAALSSQALAEASNFNFLDIHHVQGDLDDLDVDGWQLDGAVEINEQFYVTAGYTDLEPEDDLPGGSIDIDIKRIGLGYIFGENETGNFFGELSYVEAEADLSGPGVGGKLSEDGYQLGLGTRFNLGARAELRLQLDYRDVGEDSTVVRNIGLVYSFTPRVAGVAEFSDDSDLQQFDLGLRFWF